MKEACPSDDELSQLSSGTLSEERLPQVATHLDTCESCQTSMEKLTSATLHRLDVGLLDHPKLLDRASEKELVERIVAQSTWGDQAVANRSSLQPDLGFLEPTDDEELLGHLGRYDVVEVIGQGGMGIVLKATDTELKRNVAIKVLGPHLGASTKARERFLREAQAAAVLDHENVVPVHAVEGDASLPYLVMPLVDGETLQQRMQREQDVPIDDCVRIGIAISRGLAAAHAEGLIHRDIKPANILIDRKDDRERVRITDFGLARTVDEPDSSSSKTLVGTPQYMPPEQIGSKEVDTRADLFSLGAVLYQLSTGKAPFEADSIKSVVKLVEEEDPPAPSSVREAVPQWLSNAILKLLQKEPEDRFSSAEEFADLLEKHLSSPWTSQWLKVAAAFLVLFPITAVTLASKMGENEPRETTQLVYKSRLPFVNKKNNLGYSSLSQAVQEAKAGDVIQIAHTATYAQEPVDIDGKSLTIRAKPGTLPVLEARVRRAPVIRSNAPLRLVGITIRKKMEWVVASPLVEVESASLELVKCRVLRDSVSDKTRPGGKPVIRMRGRSSLAIRGCEIYAPRFYAVGMASGAEPGPEAPSDATVEIKNSIFVCRNPLVLGAGKVSPPTHVTISRSTFVCESLVRVTRRFINECSIRLENSVIACQGPAITASSSTRVLEQMQIHDLANAYSVGGEYFPIDESAPPIDSLEKWLALWNVEAPTGSIAIDMTELQDRYRVGTGIVHEWNPVKATLKDDQFQHIGADPGTVGPRGRKM